MQDHSEQMQCLGVAGVGRQYMTALLDRAGHVAGMESLQRRSEDVSAFRHRGVHIRCSRKPMQAAGHKEAGIAVS